MTTDEQMKGAVPAHVQMALDGWVAEYKELLAFRESAQGTIDQLQRQVAEADAARRHAQAVSTKLVEDKRALEHDLQCLRSVWDTMTIAYDNASLRAKEEEERARKAEAALADHIEDSRDMVTSETIASVTTWANEAFGQAEIGVQIERAKKEFIELLQLQEVDHDNAQLAEEAADVCICLFRVIGTLKPTAIDDKMKINRARKWNVNADGTAQHVKEVAN